MDPDVELKMVLEGACDAFGDMVFESDDDYEYSVDSEGGEGGEGGFEDRYLSRAEDRVFYNACERPKAPQSLLTAMEALSGLQVRARAARSGGGWGSTRGLPGRPA